jgi:hypothetical protein
MTKEYENVKICIGCGLRDICTDENEICEEKRFKHYDIKEHKEGKQMPIPRNEYYTMKECFDNCQDDDIPFIENGFNHNTQNNKEYLTRYSDGVGANLRESLSDKWQIKRADEEIKEPELMTLQDAIFKMNPGDSFKSESDGMVYIMTEDKNLKEPNHKESIPINPFTLKDQGKIIPVEPKVKSIREIYKDQFPGTPLEDGCILSFGVKCNDNGRLWEWLNHKPLREAVETLMLRIDIHYRIKDVLREPLKNLKPLKAE